MRAVDGAVLALGCFNWIAQSRGCLRKLMPLGNRAIEILVRTPKGEVDPENETVG